jgi:hypothetical protein
MMERQQDGSPHETTLNNHRHNNNTDGEAAQIYCHRFAATFPTIDAYRCTHYND